jgi:hypothetical protein
MFSKPKVQKGIARPKRLVSTTAETQQHTLIRNRGRASKERGSEEGEKKEKRWGSCARNRAHTG